VSRDIDLRHKEAERPSPSQGSRGSGDAVERSVAETRDVFMRDLDLPCGLERTRMAVGNRSVELSGRHVRIMATAGAFRVVPASDLRDPSDTDARQLMVDVRHLARTGLVQTKPYVVGTTRTVLVTLTDNGRALLEASRRPNGGQDQGFSAGFVKPRELAHDSRLYQAYLRSAERIAERGGRIRRVVLDHELKRDYQRFLQDHHRERRPGRRTVTRDPVDVAQWCQEQHLSSIDGHVQFPDVRIEFDDRDGRWEREDIEVTTPHYRGRQLAAKGQAGFTCYRATGARLGGGASGSRGGRPFDPRVAEEMLE
jgi:hypothetical protein